MAYTKQEEASEFWMLTKGILQDSRVDTDEACVILRWLQEHKRDTSFDFLIGKLATYLKDGYIDRFESKAMMDAIGSVLRVLRTEK